jgi:hypothetical protein
MGVGVSALFQRFCGGVANSQVIQMLNDMGWVCVRSEGKEELVAPVAIDTGTDDRLLVLNAYGDVVEATVTIGALEPSRNFVATLGRGIVFEIDRKP